MLCPYCSHNKLKVCDKRDSGDEIRRRRECLGCSKRFTTYERIEALDITVVKKDAKREPYDRSKILKSIKICTDKLQIGDDRIEMVIGRIEREIKNRKQKEISSERIGRIIMKNLKRLDKAAYLRFASVYQGFEDVEDFEEEIRKLVKKK